MARSKHMHQRMGQRGIKSRVAEIVSQYGVISGDDKIQLDRKNVRDLLDGIDTLRKDLLEIDKKGGIVLVEHGGVEITIYRAGSYSRKSKQKGNHGNH